MTILEKYSKEDEFDVIIDGIIKEGYKYKNKCADFVFVVINKLFNLNENSINIEHNSLKMAKGKNEFTLLNKVMLVLNKHFKYIIFNYKNDNLKKGDIILSSVKASNPNHIALYLQDDKIINSYPKTGIIVENINNSNILYIIRIVDWRHNE